MTSQFRRGLVRPAVVSGFAMAGLLSGGAVAHGAAKKDTTTNIVSLMRGDGDVQPVLGNVDPDRHGDRIIIKYFKRHSGTWVLKAKKRGVIGKGDAAPGPSWFYVEVPAVNRGLCKVVAKYPGNDTYAASHAKAVVKCATGLSRQ